MRSNANLQIITEAIERLIPGAAPACLTVEVKETLSVTGCVSNTWTGSPAVLAERIFTALFGRPDRTPEASPLAQAEEAKGRRGIEGEIAALNRAHDRLTRAPWYPARRGDVVLVHYEAVADLPAFGETYVVDGLDGGLFSMQLLAHTLADSVDQALVDAMVGCFASDACEDPLYEAWFEAGPQRLTIVRDGRVVHNGGAR